MLRTDPVSSLLEVVTEAAREVSGDPSISPSLDPAPRPELGDFSSNAAMLMAKPLGRAPREIAGELAEVVAGRLGESLDRTEVAGPGFLNLFLTDAWYREAVEALSGGAAPVPAGSEPEDVLVEFVSANPTGPLTAASGRHAAYGDAVARLLATTGHKVSTEYYVNDGGSQIENFAASIAARMTGTEPPENGYRGDYVNDLAERASQAGISPEELDRLALEGVAWMVEGIRESLDRFGVRMDDFFSERSLYEEGLVEKGLERLRAAGHTFEEEGALWLRTTEFGDDKDRVLVRSGGEPTYFGADVAYHADKAERGHIRLLDVLGADHHGYVARMDAAIKSLDREDVVFEARILQMIHLVEGGKRTKMSKRAGDIVTLDELVADIGVDAARFFLLQRSHDSTMDLDLDLARSQSSDNPVYYVQYAHARIQSILRKAADRPDGSLAKPDAGPLPGAVPVEPAEKALISLLLAFPAEVHQAAERRAPHRICAYATEAAAAFHAFYRDCQVVNAPGEGVEQARLGLCESTAATLHSALGLLGISAPDSM
ncbi:MAG: arginine--tRNA ligase [Solirubrobacterales bacterium]